jgi:uncharacterized protein YbaP (TraB family)
MTTRPGAVKRRLIPSLGALGLAAALLSLTLFGASLISAAAASADGSFLWSVEDQAGSRMYLYGSIHMAVPEVYPLPEVVEGAFKESAELVVEADVTGEGFMGEMMEAAFKNGIYLDGRDLWGELGPDLSAGLKACAARAGLPPEMLQNLKPWLAAITLEATRVKALGFDESLGLDRHFLGQAKARGIPVVELETAAEQASMFTELSDEDSLKLIKATILECDSGGDEVKELVDVWRRGDLAGFEEVFFKVYREAPELEPLLDRIIYDRNERMFNSLARRLVPGRAVFAVVGAAHMIGPRGLPERFRARGLRVTRL